MPNFFLLSSLSTPPASSWSRVFFCWRKVRCDTLITCRMRMACVEFTYTSKLNHSINVFDELVDLSIYTRIWCLVDICKTWKLLYMPIEGGDLWRQGRYSFELLTG